MANRLHIVVLLVGLLAGCEKAIDRTAEIPAPVLSLVQASKDKVELRIAGAFALRGLQGTLVYDPQQLKLTKVEAGKQAERLDRVFWSDPSRANGRLVVGLSDTRQVMLPARGALLSFQLTGLKSGARTKLTLDNPVGAIDGGERVKMQSAALEVTAP